MPALHTLIVFARLPQLGAAKTRLVPELGVAAAHRLYEALFEDTLALANAVPWPRLLSFAGDGRPPDLPVGWEAVRQPDRSFGERMSWSFETAFARGAEGCVLIGADAPHLPLAYLVEARAALQTHEVVLGPTHDGGYYLLGLRRPSPWIFANVTWGTDTVFNETVQLVDERGLDCHVLPEEFDVDTVDEARRLQRLLAREPERAPRCAQALFEILKRAAS